MLDSPFIGHTGGRDTHIRPLQKVRLVVYTEARWLGGAEFVLGHLLAELDDGFEAAIVAVDEQVAHALASRRPETPQYLVAPVRNKVDLRGIAAHVRTIRALRPDIVHVNMQDPSAGQYGMVAGLLSRSSVIAVEHNVSGDLTWLQRRSRRRLYASLAAHVVVGELAARELEKLIGLPQGSVEAIHNGVPDIPLRPVERPRPGPVVGTVGRLGPEKGFDVLLRAMATLPDVTAILVGEGPERQALTQLAKELGIDDRVLMLGWVERQRDYLPVFDVFAVPSRSEVLPLTVIEAMLASRAIVASDVGSMSEAIEHRSTGLLVPPECPTALAEAIRSLLDDPNRREAMGIRARETAVRSFTAPSMARSYEALYRRVLNEHA
jgi:glycosyltransferase involved in cell wall biosynthesis